MKKKVLKLVVLLVFVAAVAALLVSSACGGPKAGEVLDEARAAGRTPASFPAADEDYFREMDGGIPLTPNEVKGRNMWNVWTGGNDRFWDHIGVKSFGALDLLKTVSNHPSLKYSRSNRWSWLGLVNEPCFEKPTGGDPQRFGLWLDRRSAGCPPDPFENEAKYPGVKIGARGKNMPVGSFYGYGSGILGLRLFPNPDFDEAAAKKWDAERYYTDPKYYNDKDLVRPYRVGMSCGFCHIGPDPVRPPDDPENPKWENLNSSVGAQYFWIDRIFDWAYDETSYINQMFKTSRPGSLDTSLVSTDNINNPRTMNAIYLFGARLKQAERFGKETLGPGSADNKQFNDYPQTAAALGHMFQPPSTVFSPRVLKDGSDAVGGLGALNRVYLNIGLFSEEWLLHFNPLVGGKKTTPIPIATARKNSSYWEATEMQTPDMALFFLKATPAHLLKDAPGGAALISQDQAQLDRGRVVFAENCARCHSSKLPTPAEGLDPGGCAGKDYLKCWDKYWAWTKTEDFKSKMRDISAAPDFLADNYLSAEHRVPVTLLQTNACSPLATNAIRDNIWDNFSSDTYKELPAVGELTAYNPSTGDPFKFKAPGGGRGYTRPPSLVSLWSTAPFLLNNSLGPFDPSPSVAARVGSFEKSIEQLLWPERREKDPVLEKAFAEKGIKDFPGVVDRVTKTSYIVVRSGYLSGTLSGLVGWGEWLFPSFYGKCKERTDLQRGDICLGPIPAGAPIGLLTNLDLRPEDADIRDRLAHDKKLLRILHTIKEDLKKLGDNPTDEQAREVFRNLVQPLMEVSKCPDYIVNRGHYFGAGYDGEPALSDEDKRALIEYLKTF